MPNYRWNSREKNKISGTMGGEWSVNLQTRLNSNIAQTASAKVRVTAVTHDTSHKKFDSNSCFWHLGGSLIEYQKHQQQSPQDSITIYFAQL